MLQGNSSNHKGDFYCLNCFNSYTTKNKPKEHEEICNNHSICQIEMPEWVNKTKHNPGEKSLKKTFVIYLGLEFILKKLQSHNNNNNIEESYAEKEARHEPSGWSMFIRCSFDEKENKLNYYRGKDCIEKLCKKLKESATDIINREKKEMVPLTHEVKIFYNEQEIYYICKEKFYMIKMIKII